MTIFFAILLYASVVVGSAIALAFTRNYLLAVLVATLHAGWVYVEDNIGKWTIEAYCDAEARQVVFARLEQVEAIYQPNVDPALCSGCGEYLGRIGYRYVEFDAPPANGKTGQARPDGDAKFVRGELIESSAQCAKNQRGEPLVLHRDAPGKCVRFEAVRDLKASIYRQTVETSLTYSTGSLRQLTMEYRLTSNSALVARYVAASWRPTTLLSRLFGEGNPSDFGGYACRPIRETMPLEAFAVPRARY
jgi:hypothetical protein